MTLNHLRRNTTKKIYLEKPSLNREQHGQSVPQKNKTDPRKNKQTSKQKRRQLNDCNVNFSQHGRFEKEKEKNKGKKTTTQ